MIGQCRPMVLFYVDDPGERFLNYGKGAPLQQQSDWRRSNMVNRLGRKIWEKVTGSGL